jgi:hypothetical protein
MWSASLKENFDKMPGLKSAIFILPLLIILCSCGKGYEIRFLNYYTEPIDSVEIVQAGILFQTIEPGGHTAYQKIKRGNHQIKIVSRSKKRLETSLFIPGKGSGKRSIQVDGLSQLSILEE